MAELSKLLVGGPGFLKNVVTGPICVAGIVFTSYDRYVMVLKVSNLSLFAYVAALFAAHVQAGPRRSPACSCRGSPGVSS